VSVCQPDSSASEWGSLRENFFTRRMTGTLMEVYAPLHSYKHLNSTTIWQVYYSRYSITNTKHKN